MPQETTPPLPIAPECVSLPDAEVRLWRGALAAQESAALFAALLGGIDWRTEEVLIFGQRRRVPRLVAWHGDPDAHYTYSGTAHEPSPWTAELSQVRARVEALTLRRFNSVLLNRYRDGRDGMGWHADDEPELGRDPAIASVSLGAPRRFVLRHRRRKDLLCNIELRPGDVLLMSGPTQHHWVHALPKTSRPVAERLNLTFRCIRPRAVME
jgi:alkylated DNA repair dioxygenase AlkB